MYLLVVVVYGCLVCVTGFKLDVGLLVIIGGVVLTVGLGVFLVVVFCVGLVVGVGVGLVDLMVGVVLM